MISIYEDCDHLRPSIYAGKKLRTVYLNRKPNPKKISMHVNENIYEFIKEDNELKIYKGISHPKEYMIVDDERHFTATISMALDLFSNHDAQMICIPKENPVPFRSFATRFLDSTRNDDFIYHFVGTGMIGNPWAESGAKMLKRRARWSGFSTRSLESTTHRLNVQMVARNIFTPIEIDNNYWLSPFNYAGAKYETYEET